MKSKKNLEATNFPCSEAEVLAIPVHLSRPLTSSKVLAFRFRFFCTLKWWGSQILSNPLRSTTWPLASSTQYDKLKNSKGKTQQKPSFARERKEREYQDHPTHLDPAGICNWNPWNRGWKKSVVNCTLETIRNTRSQGRGNTILTKKHNTKIYKLSLLPCNRSSSEFSVIRIRLFIGISKGRSRRRIHWKSAYNTKVRLWGLKLIGSTNKQNLRERWSHTKAVKKKTKAAT